MNRNDRERAESPSGAMHTGQAAGTAGGPTPRTDPADTGTEAGEAARPARHDAGGPGDGMRTGGSAGTASGHDPMPDEVDELRRNAEPPSRERTRGDGAGTV